MKRRTNIPLLGGLFALAMLSTTIAGPLEDGQSAYQRGDYAAAMGYWRPLADRGDASTQNNIGILYRYGRGVPEDASA